MKLIIQAALFASAVSLIFTGNIFGQYEMPQPDDEDENNVARDSSWELGKNESIPETEVIYNKECECP